MEKVLPSYPLKIHRIKSENFAPLPCIRIPMRKTRPAAQTQAIVVTITKAIPASISHKGTPGGTDCLATSNIGVANGKKEQTLATVPFGS